MGDYTAWEIIVIILLVAVVLWAGKTPAFLRKRQEAKPASEADPGGGPAA